MENTNVKYYRIVFGTSISFQIVDFNYEIINEELDNSQIVNFNYL